MGRPGSPRPIRWRKGEIIGAGAYGRVYMGMNLDSGELLAVKQVLISINNVAKEKAQAHIQELEEEVRLLRNLSHPNIVRYLGTAREEEALNILLEFVPGGSIASLLGKFGSFTEPVIRMYTKQLLIGLEYLHSNNILHRDIKGANILVDNKGCIKLADFGASKKVVELATISEAKSMKGTPYWMAPEVIRQTGHNWQADIWSVGCTVIEMATGKPPWSNLQEVAALFHIGTTKSHPPIPDHLSVQGKNFLLKCLQRDPRLRLSAAELSKHPFVTQRMSEGAEGRKSSVGRSGCLGSDSHQTGGPRTSTYNISRNRSFRPGEQLSFLQRQTSMKSFNAGQTQRGALQESGRQLRGEMSYGAEPNCSVRLGSVTSEFPNGSVRLDSLSDEPCSVRIDSLRSERWPSAHVGRPQSIKGVRMDSLRDEPCSVRIDSLRSERWPSARVGGPQSIKGDDFLTQSFNPMSEPSFNDCEGGTLRTMDGELRKGDTGEENEVGASEGQQDDDEEVTESKIRAFLDDKAQELRHLQTPLYEEFNNIWNSGNENHRPNEGSFLAPLSPAPSPGRGRGPAYPCNSKSPTSKGSFSGGRSVGVRSSRDSEASVTSDSPIAGGTHPTNSVFSPLLEVPSPRLNEWKGLLNDANHMIPPPSPSVNSAERQRLWKEELQQELELKREEKRKLTRQASTLSNITQSPNKEKSIARHASRLSGTPPTPR